jgi:2-oxoglutarate ferredoxin oxidoreductase subunit alpha
VPPRLRLQRTNAVATLFIEGNSAAALSRLQGATVCAWYPITPSSSLADAFTGHCRRLRATRKARKVAIVQAEDGSPHWYCDRGCGTARGTRLARPGISLMQEFWALPISPKFAVIFDAARGPSTGMPTHPAGD